MSPVYVLGQTRLGRCPACGREVFAGAGVVRSHGHALHPECGQHAIRPSHTAPGPESQTARSEQDRAR